MQRTDTSISQARASVETPLKRGKACLTCRFLKIKCDGRKPICGPCLRHPKEDSCEYTDGPGRSRHRALEETITRLEARIQELENPSIATPSVALHHPYGSPSRRRRTQSPLAPLRAESSGRMSRTPSSSTYKSAPSPTNASDSGALTEEYSPALLQSLIDAFLPHSSRFGLFLDPEDLRDVFSAAPGSPSHVAKVVIYAVCLWGAHLSPPESPHRAREASFLLASLRSAATHLSTHDQHPRRFLNFIQAELLLAHYFYRIGKPLEARIHADAAGSLILSSGMHCTRAVARPSPDAYRTSLSPPAEDPKEMGTMINGFWTTYVTIRHMALASSPSFMTVFDAPSIQVDTPWPMDWKSYREGNLPDWGLAPIQAFLRNTIPGERNAQLDSNLTRITKASIILHQATFLANQQDATSELYASNYHLVYRLIHEYRRSLPLYATLEDEEDAYAVYLSRSLIDGAEIRLCERYKLDENARRARVDAAKDIFVGNTTFSLDTLGSVTPILGDLWQSACIVLVEEITRLQSGYDASNQTVDTMAALDTGMNAIRRYATDNNVHMNGILANVTNHWPWHTPPMVERPTLELATDVPVASTSSSHRLAVPSHLQPLSIAQTKSEDSDTTSVYTTPVEFPHPGHPQYYQHHPQ